MPWKRVFQTFKLLTGIHKTYLSTPNAIKHLIIVQNWTIKKIPNWISYCKVANRSTSHLIAPRTIFRLLMKGKFDVYLLGKKLTFGLVAQSTLCTVKRKLERLQFPTSSSFVKIWSACSCEFKAYFLNFLGFIPLAFWSRKYSS